MDWTRGYSSEWHVHEVDVATWADGPEVGRVDGASIERVTGGLCESGTFSVTKAVGEDFRERYLRLVLVASQDGMRERVEVATMLCSSESGHVDRKRDSASVTGRSVLYPASARQLLEGSYAPKGANGAEYAASLLRGSIAAPVAVDGAFTIGVNVVFDLGDSYLDAAWAVLDAGNFTMQVDGHGTVHVLPTPSEPTVNADGGLFVPGIDYDLDMSGIKNRYTAMYGGLSATAVNDDPSSPTSTVSRGYVEDEVDKSPVLLDGETLAAYAVRKLREGSVARRTLGYEREYHPAVLPGSVLSAHVPAGGLEGRIRSSRQSLSIGRRISVREDAVLEVTTWLG